MKARLLQAIVLAYTLIFNAGSVHPAQANISCQTTLQITSSNPQIRSHQLSGNHLVWIELDTLIYYDISMDTTHPIGVVYPKEFDAAGDYIAWIDASNSVYLYTISTSTKLPVATNAAARVQVQIDGSRVYWAVLRKPGKLNGPKRIFMYDIATQLTTQILPKVRGWDADSGNVVWTDSERVYLYDVATNANQRISRHRRGLGNPHIEGQYVIWWGNVYKNVASHQWLAQDIFLYNLNATVRTRITDFGPRRQLITLDLKAGMIGWSEYIGLSNYPHLSFYNIATSATGGFSTDTADYSGANGFYVGGRYLSWTTSSWQVNDPDLAPLPAAILADTLSSDILELQAEDFNASGIPVVDGANVAWLGYKFVFDQNTYEAVLTEQELFLTKNCVVPPSHPLPLPASPDSPRRSES